MKQQQRSDCSSGGPLSGGPTPKEDAAVPAQTIAGAERKAERAQRLSAELRANLRRRKAQAQARARQHDAAGEHGVDSPAPGSPKPPATD